jgi:hypothetical protein
MDGHPHLPFAACSFSCPITSFLRSCRALSFFCSHCSAARKKVEESCHFCLAFFLSLPDLICLAFFSMSVTWPVYLSHCIHECDYVICSDRARSWQTVTIMDQEQCAKCSVTLASVQWRRATTVNTRPAMTRIEMELQQPVKLAFDERKRQ